MRGLASEKKSDGERIRDCGAGGEQTKKKHNNLPILRKSLVSNSQRFRIEGLGTTSEVASLGAKRLCVYPNSKIIWPTRIAPRTLETKKLGG